MPMALPVIKNLLAKKFAIEVGGSLLLGIVIAEIYWHYSCLPRQRKRDQYFKDIGVEINKPF